jgi:hypothetical protein
MCELWSADEDCSSCGYSEIKIEKNDNVTKLANLAFEEIKDNAEIVALLKELVQTDCLLCGTPTNQYSVELMDYDYSRDEYPVLSINNDLLQCLRDAKEKEWQP